MLEISIKELYNTLKMVKPFLSKDKSVPHVLSEYVEISNKGVFCTGLQIAVRFKWYYTDEFRVVVDFAKLWGLAKSLYKMDKSASVTITKGDNVDLTFKGNVYSIDSLDKEYAVTGIKTPEKTVRVDDIQKCLSFAKICGKRQRYALDTLQVKTEERHLRVTATDGKRLLTAKLEATHGNIDMLISGAHALKLSKALKGLVCMSDGFFMSDNVKVRFKPVHDRFPPVEHITSIEYNTCIMLITKELVNWVKVLSSLPGNEKLDFITTDGLSLVNSSGNSFFIGNFDDEIRPIKFDAKLMLSLLAFCGEHVELHLKADSPIKGISGDVSWYLMPILKRD